MRIPVRALDRPLHRRGNRLHIRIVELGDRKPLLDRAHSSGAIGRAVMRARSSVLATLGTYTDGW